MQWQHEDGQPHHRDVAFLHRFDSNHWANAEATRCHPDGDNSMAQRTSLAQSGIESVRIRVRIDIIQTNLKSKRYTDCTKSGVELSGNHSTAIATNTIRPHVGWGTKRFGQKVIRREKKRKEIESHERHENSPTPFAVQSLSNRCDQIQHDAHRYTATAQTPYAVRAHNYTNTRDYHLTGTENGVATSQTPHATDTIDRMSATRTHHTRHGAVRFLTHIMLALVVFIIGVAAGADRPHPLSTAPIARGDLFADINIDIQTVILRAIVTNRDMRAQQREVAARR